MEVLFDSQDVRSVEASVAPPLVLPDNAVLVRIQTAAFTANVVSYALGGSTLGYFKFFPTAIQNKVHVPTWAVGVVVASRSQQISVGERLYGLMPYGSDYVVLETTKVRSESFLDASRAPELSVVYNTFSRLSMGLDPFCSSANASLKDDETLVLYRPLFLTAWLLAEHSSENDALVLTSASSKTAICLAFLTDLRVVGVTSSRNKTFVESLRLYDDVTTYEDLEIHPMGRVGIVDMSGDAEVLRSIKKATPSADVTLVGATHWDKGLESAAELGTFFFAPSYAVEVSKKLGEDYFSKKVGEDFRKFAKFVEGFHNVERRFGAFEAARTYRQALEFLDPSKSVVLGAASQQQRL